ncbi:uncharacterized protein B0H18DRAFT_1008325 [Fomitopsis serialis]|uniref:uncharacterized protein n=1 Tax=Fomitopsis serialis TaxID=139415 RepID=UPI00200849E0|nr:uncharacterized protein B0H18DRAFT_1008325 [Neoantrodia serialis]KAH9925784.1 hypothetical protein B0H18DRAFT_1008325 [Neoantrodia serialis]
MSTADIAEELIAASHQHCAFTVVLVYDYTLTIDREIGLFWFERKLSGASIICALARTVALGYVIVACLVNPASWTPTRCKGVLLASDLLVLLSYLIWAVVSAFRVYALTHRKWASTILTLALGIVPAAMNAATISVSAYQVQSLGGKTSCWVSNPVHPAMSSRYARLRFFDAFSPRF